MATRINREALRQRIKELAGLSDDERTQLLELVNTKKYGLVWENHPEAVEERLRTHLPVLDEVPERYIPGSSPSSPNHILIEGDNLEALTALTYTHEGRIDVIYIDPPYNTGNKDFVYNDHYVDADDDYRHSKWLSFMSKRLRIAKRLLSPKGVIFISIDDNEQGNLRILCDELFGLKNFIGQLIIKTATDNNPSQINTEHEYMLCYCANKIIQDNWERTSQAAKDIIKKYKELLSRYQSIEIIQKELRKWIKLNKDNLPQVAHYNNVDEKGVYSSSGNSSNPHPGGYMYDIIHPITHKPCPKPNNGWRWPFTTFEKYDIQGEIAWGIDETTQPHVKKRIETATEYLRTLIYEDNRGTTLALADMFCGEKVFDNPKPIRVVSKAIDFASNKNSIILDFFAGSGTTMHAVMQLNKEDGGHRQCILVTNNENNICEEVTYERNRRVIEGYTTPKGVKVDGLTDNSLRYYRTRLLPRQRTNRNMRDLMAAATDLLCIKEDIFDELEIKNLAIRNIRRHVRLFGKGNQYMLIIYSEEAIPRIVQWIAQSDFLPKEPIKIYTFSYTNYAYDDDFAEVEERVQLCALPAAIYEAYRRVLPQEDRYYDNEIIDGSDTDEGKEDNQ